MTSFNLLLEAILLIEDNLIILRLRVNLHRLFDLWSLEPCVLLQPQLLKLPGFRFLRTLVPPRLPLTLLRHYATADIAWGNHLRLFHLSLLVLAIWTALVDGPLVYRITNDTAKGLLQLRHITTLTNWARWATTHLALGRRQSGWQLLRMARSHRLS